MDVAVLHASEKWETARISDAQGKLLTSVMLVDNDEVFLFFDLDDLIIRLHHEQDCCESVYLESGGEDLKALAGHFLEVAEERTHRPDASDIHSDSETWTFYEFRTVKGSATLRWIGTSNGYYSESVDVHKITGRL